VWLFLFYNVIVLIREHIAAMFDEVFFINIEMINPVNMWVMLLFAQVLLLLKILLFCCLVVYCKER